MGFEEKKHLTSIPQLKRERVELLAKINEFASLALNTMVKSRTIVVPSSFPQLPWAASSFVLPSAIPSEQTTQTQTQTQTLTSSPPSSASSSPTQIPIIGETPSAIPSLSPSLNEAEDDEWKIIVDKQSKDNISDKPIEEVLFL